MLIRPKYLIAPMAFALALLWALLAPTVLAAKKPPIGVLYPEVREPFLRIFEDVVRGIKSGSDAPVKVMVLKQSDGPEVIERWLSKHDPAVLVALGSSGKKVAKQFSSQVKILNGASFLSSNEVDNGWVGISLTPSPAHLFERLLGFKPGIERISVVYHEETNGWLVDLAKKHAAESGVELIAKSAEDVRDAAILYRDVLEAQEYGKDAIWLLQGDPTLDERSLLPTILNEAWSKNFVVFSSNPSHVRRGVLFSLFPDNVEMGKSLAVKAKDLMAGKNGGVQPLQDLRIAVNVRTAEHLKLRISRAQERDFDLIFPTQ